MERRLKQTKERRTYFYFLGKEVTNKPVKVAAAKDFSPMRMLW